MKLITLNIWGGYLKQEILNFFNNYQEIDIFCLQEVYCKADKKISTCDLKLSLDIFTEIQDELPNHIGYFRPVVNDIYGELQMMNFNRVKETLLMLVFVALLASCGGAEERKHEYFSKAKQTNATDITSK